MSTPVKVSDASVFTVGNTYVSFAPGTSDVDVGTFTVTAVDIPDAIITVTANDGWVPIVGHDVVVSSAVGDRRGFAFEALGFYVGLERGLAKIPPGNRGKA